MQQEDLARLVSQGESSKVQFKERLPHLDSVAQEMIAFSNSRGGVIVFGVNDKTGNLNGLSFAEIQELNQQLVNVASQKVYPPIYITTETVTLENQHLVVVSIAEGNAKPYKDSSGIIYMKNGTDKRKVTSNDEIARLLQSGGAIYADELPVFGSNIKDVDIEQFNAFLLRKYRRPLEELGIEFSKVLENLNLSKNGVLTLAGLLFFSKNRSRLRPQFSVQCVAVDAYSLEGNTFSDNEFAFDGTLNEVFEKTIDFIGRHIKKVPETTGFNSQTKWEIPYEVFEELIVNALVHRDYFISSTIKIQVFKDRFEIVSPGKLPNSLTIENIKNGISIARNPVLQSIAQYVLPYKGLGTGVARSYSLYPEIEMENRVDKEQFAVIIKRNS